ncbi:hypothetical protein C8Q75DRAFT_454081 [Abortiporus biennis]|nr:hypothetical protein C8Q75DRAFT_454081 [Abortiporus biennis]
MIQFNSLVLAEIVSFDIAPMGTDSILLFASNSGFHLSPHVLLILHRCAISLVFTALVMQHASHCICNIFLVSRVHRGCIHY